VRACSCRTNISNCEENVQLLLLPIIETVWKHWTDLEGCVACCQTTDENRIFSGFRRESCLTQRGSRGFIHGLAGIIHLRCLYMHISFLGIHITIIPFTSNPECLYQQHPQRPISGLKVQFQGTNIRQAKLQGLELRSQSPPVLSQIHKAEDALAVAPFLGCLIQIHVSCVDVYAV
jgi:hypothetical protein